MSINIERYRQKLLDLSARNRLLSFRHSRGIRHDYARVIDTTLEQLCEQLSSGRKMRFSSTDAGALLEPLDFDLPLLFESQVARKKPITTPYDSNELDKRVWKIFDSYRKYRAERGVGVLFAMFGFVQWQDSATKKPHEAPLVILPLDMERKSGGKISGEQHRRFSIYGSGQAATNQTLQAKLKKEFGLEIPDFASETEAESLETYLHEVERTLAETSVAHFKRWATIGVLPFSRMAMWADLNSDNWDGVSEHPVVGRIFGGLAEDGPRNPPEDDGIIRSGEYLDLPLPADSSQREVVRKGLSEPVLVVQGPPGTGKSQTIANLICAAIAAGEKVLFVAEKAVAISVVRRRLEEAGLGVFAFTLETDNVPPKHVVDKLRRRIDFSPSREVDISLENKRNKRKRESQKVRDYGETVTRTVKELDMPLGKLAWIYQSLSERLGDLALAHLPPVDAQNWDDVESKVDEARQLGGYIETTQDLAINPWRGVENIPPQAERKIRDLLKLYDASWYSPKSWIRGVLFRLFLSELGNKNITLFTSLFQHSRCQEWLKQLQDAGTSAREQWRTLLRFEKPIKDVGFGHVTKALRERRILPSQAADSVSFQIHAPLYRAEEQDYCSLDTGDVLNDTIARCGQLDEEIRNLVRRDLVANIAANFVPPGARGRVSDYTEGNLIRHEVTKTRAHRPVRELVQRASGAIQALQPAWMMSPLCVASFLAHPNQGGPTFDLVILDEASQQRPEEALGALLRGSRAVIVGDEHQLPPSPFFRTKEDEDEEEEIDVGLESILDSARASESIPKSRLLWHYRSLHRDLIAFSNHKFYDNSLFVPPCQCADGIECGVSLRYLDNAYYKNRLNPDEKEAIIEEVMAHIRTNPEDSLGVVTMNSSQTNAIEDGLHEIEANGDADADALAKFMARHENKEPLFVKSLEDVQGDERDVILVGTLYGPDEESGQIPQRFGPINVRDYGHRRINVLVTRAKRRLRVVTSLKFTDVRAPDNASPGRLAFREYLEYAESHKFPPLGGDGESQGDPESYFEEIVKSFLERNGYKVVPQVGVEKFRIDLVVYDQDNSSRPLAGVECDGKSHLSPDAQDQDYLRQKILESRGWIILRVWGTDWFHDRVTAGKRLLAALEDLKTSKR